MGKKCNIPLNVGLVSQESVELLQSVNFGEISESHFLILYPSSMQDTEAPLMKVRIQELKKLVKRDILTPSHPAAHVLLI